jgi:hypothetical protein
MTFKSSLNITKHPCASLNVSKHSLRTRLSTHPLPACRLGFQCIIYCPYQQPDPLGTFIYNSQPLYVTCNKSYKTDRIYSITKSLDYAASMSSDIANPLPSMVTVLKGSKEGSVIAQTLRGRTALEPDEVGLRITHSGVSDARTTPQEISQWN